MTFAQRQINLEFSTSTETVYLEGLRCHAVIQHPGGYASAASLELRVWGMSIDEMNKFSSVGSDMVRIGSMGVKVYAGTVGKAIAEVYNGSLSRAYIDFGSVPDVSFACSGTCTLVDWAKPSKPNTFPGFADAEYLITQLAAQIGYTVNNPDNAHAVVQNQYVTGSVMSQIFAIARAAAIPMQINGKVINIWPNDGFRSDITIDLGPNNGLVGYPTYYPQGFIVKSEFNPIISNGRRINLTSVIPKANGLWPTQNVTHEISTLMPDGPWFTTAVLSPSLYVQQY